MPSERGRPYLVSEHPLFDTWRGMLERCTNPACRAWPNYGGRGIRVYEPWANGYGSSRRFIDWAEANLGPKPEGWTLDRIDNDGDYVPGNLRWVPLTEQPATRRSTIQATLDGKPMSLHRALIAAGLLSSQATHAIVRLRKGGDLREALSIYHLDPSRITIISLPPTRVWRRT